MLFPYVDETTLKGLSQTDCEVVDRIRSRRAPATLQALDLALLHSPPVADGWNSILGSIRNKTSLSAALREFVICRVAVCNSAWYEWDDHAPLAVQAGWSAEAMQLVKQRNLESVSKELREHIGLGDKEWAVLMLTDDMTRNVRCAKRRFGSYKST